MNTDKTGIWTSRHWIRVPKVLACLVLAACPLAAHAEVKAKDAWVRATVPAQKSTGAFMTLTSTEDVKVVKVTSPVAKIVEIHETISRDGVMAMEALKELALPAGKPVELRPGGKHVMLLGLSKQVSQGEEVPLVLTVEDRRGTRSVVEIRAGVRPLAAR